MWGNSSSLYFVRSFEGSLGAKMWGRSSYLFSGDLKEVWVPKCEATVIVFTFSGVLVVSLVLKCEGLAIVFLWKTFWGKPTFVPKCEAMVIVFSLSEILGVSLVPKCEGVVVAISLEEDLRETYICAKITWKGPGGARSLSAGQWANGNRINFRLTGQQIDSWLCQVPFKFPNWILVKTHYSCLGWIE